ncbi:MAG: lysylphosphatidylglycerol synthase transmembrane domain-containing protein [Anaerolineae bacterium]|nr:flippase-like domain-containing protein [Anaerolineae bacterium]MDW8298537.1 lysylphosphatidylglycerol synthase transmembrane domain-containing protein [Anaerolineae bacterium]
MKRWQSVVLGVIISVATLAYALHGNDLSRIGDELASGRYVWVLPCGALMGLGLWFRGLRWRFLLNERLTTTHSFHITNISYFLNAWLPLRLGEVARAYLVTRLKPPISMFTALSSVVVERLIDLLAVVVLVVIAVQLTDVPSEVQVSAQLIGVVSVSGMFVLAFFAARRHLTHAIVNFFLKILPFLERLGVRSLADKVLDGIAPLGSLRGVGYSLWWSVWAWAASIVAGYVLLFAFYDQPNWAAALLMIAAAALAIALPAVPGSVGPFEAAIIVGLQLSGMVDPANGLPQERAFAFAVVLHLVNAACYVLFGYIGLLHERVSLREVFRTARDAVIRKPAVQPVSELPTAEG